MSRTPGVRLWRPALLLGLPLIVRLLCLLQLRSDPFFQCLAVDARTNHDMAVRIASGAFTRHEPFWQPPLYPYFLALLYKIAGPHPDVARVVQIVLGSLSCLLIFRLGDRFFGRRAAWVAWTVAALYGPFLYFDLQLLNASLAVFLLLAFLERITAAGMSPSDARGTGPAPPRTKSPPVRTSVWRGPAAAGLLLGLAAINVATMIVAIPVALLWLVRQRSRAPVRSGWGPVFIFLAATAAPVLLVTTSNVAVSGEPVLISWNGGVNFWIGNNPDYASTVAIRPGRAWTALTAEPLNAGVAGSGASSAWFFDKSFRWIRRHPGDWARLLLHKARLYLRGDEIPRNQEIYPFREHAWPLRLLLWIHGIAFPFGVLLPLGVLGMALRFGKGAAPPSGGAGPGRPRSGAAELAAWLWGALSLAAIAFFIAGRYRLPAVPLLILFAGSGAVEAVLVFRAGGRGALLVPGLLALAAAAVANTGLPRMPVLYNSDAYTDLGIFYGGSGRPADAERQYETALRLNPDNFEAADNLGGMLLRRRKLDEAEALFRRILAAWPNDPKALVNVGNVWFYRGDVYRAGGYYLRASLAAPGDPDAANNLRGVESAASRLEQEQMGRNREVFLAALERSVREQPDNAFLAGRLLALLEGQGLYNRALEVVQTALRSRPQDPALLQAESRLRTRLDASRQP